MAKDIRTPESKILDAESAKRERRRLREEGKVVAFTNGCFDILHAGHVSLFTFARQQGDVLFVGINSDESIRRIKGETRPILPESDRALLLAALEMIDYVVIFGEDRVDRLVGDIVPDVIVKGAQWEQEVHGREIVEAAGGRVVLAPMAEGRSTTDIVATILATATPSKDPA